MPLGLVRVALRSPIQIWLRPWSETTTEVIGKSVSPEATIELENTPGPPPKGTITLNPSLVAAHPSCIEYVVAHELCHRKVMKHNQRFYRLLERVVPDWQARRDRLNNLR